MFADQEIFDILSIPFLQGNRQDALARPGTIVLSKGMARKYFGDEDPVGQPLEINGGNYEITGVVADSPVNTHVKYALIASMATLSGQEEMMANWHSTMFFTYLKVKPGVDMNRFENAVSTISDPYTAERLSARGVKYRYFLQPMTGIHLHSHVAYDIEPSGNPLFVTIFTIVGFFILLIACLGGSSILGIVIHGKTVDIL